MKKRSDTCDFCAFSSSSDQVVAETKHFWVVKNIFGYDIWDDTDVQHQLMIVPKRHIVGMYEFNPVEERAFFEILREYEKNGYSLYSRAPQNIAKSVLHQHSHLIKLDRKRKKFKLYIRKPHILITK